MNDPKLEKKLDAIIELLQGLLAVELFKQNVTQDEICKRLHVGKQTVNKILKSVKKN
jgi:DNA-binding transcriptional regulator LsrR (DeoR family)